MRKLFSLIVLATLATACTNTTKQNDEQLLKQALELHESIITIDSHTDTPLLLTRENFDFNGSNNESRGKVTLKKMEEGKLDAAFFAVFIGQDDRNPNKYDEVHNRALSIFESIHKSTKKHSDRSAVATSPSDAEKLKKEGKRAIYIGVENGYPIGKDITRLEQYYDLGARYLTLSHTRNNDICDSSTDPNGPEHNGLSSFGRKVVKKLNRLGMMIDVSHISDDAFNQVLEHTQMPIIASHSNARAICNHPRNLNDEMLKKLAQNGGVIQVCLLSSYVKESEPQPKRDSARNALRDKYNNFQNLSPEVREKAVDEWYALDEKFPPILATVSDLVDHIDHIVETIGIDYVGIGSDFDGGGAIEGCFDAGEMTNITVELLRRGYSKEEIQKIWGGNFLRVFREVERFAQNHK
ncbi:MAG: dipeptidase [Perlabentimonas sp.]